MRMLARITRIVRTYPFLGAGILLGSAFLAPSLWALSVCGFALLAAGIHAAPNTRAAIRGSIGAGIIKGLFATAWILDVFPADWIGDASRTEQLVFLALGWVGCGVSLGLGFALVGGVSAAARNAHSAFRAAAFGFSVVLAEQVGSYIFSLYTLGSTTTLNSYFGFGMSGFLLADHRFLAGFALIGGVYMLSFLIGTIGYVFTLLTERYSARTALIPLCTLFLFSVVPGPHTWNSLSFDTRVAVVTTSFPSSRTVTTHDLTVRSDVMMRGIEEALTNGARVVALPEDARLGVLDGNERTLEMLASLSHEPGAVVIDSYRTEHSDGSATIRGYIYDLDAGVIYESEKRYIVPIGEYMPFLHGRLISLLGGADFFEYMTYIPGTLSLKSSLPPRIPTLLYCFESGATSLLRERITARTSDLIVHPVSHGWFHNPYSLWNQERQMLMVQSIYARTPILQAGNRAPSALYFPNGTVTTGSVIERGTLHETLLFAEAH